MEQVETCSGAKMKAVRFYRSSLELKLEEVPRPQISRSDDVLVQVAFSGICGTDLHAIKGNYPTTEKPFTLGHEFSGVVSAVGEDVKSVKVGDHVTVDPYKGCFKCRHCANGNPHFCQFDGPRGALGFFQDGGWAEYCVAPAQRVHLISPSLGLGLDLASLVETLSTIQHGIDRIGPMPHDANVLIIGAGIIGILYACIFHRHGVRNVIVSEVFEERRKRIKVLELGYQALAPEETRQLLAKACEEDLEGNGMDYVVDCSGYAPAVEEAFAYLRSGGKMCLFGMAPPTASIKVQPFKIVRKELTILGAFTNPFTYPRAIGLTAALGERYLHFDKLAIETFQLEDFQKALEALASGRISKAVFKFSL